MHLTLYSNCLLVQKVRAKKDETSDVPRIDFSYDSDEYVAEVFNQILDKNSSNLYEIQSSYKTMILKLTATMVYPQNIGFSLQKFKAAFRTQMK